MHRNFHSVLGLCVLQIWKSYTTVIYNSHSFQVSISIVIVMQSKGVLAFDQYDHLHYCIKYLSPNFKHLATCTYTISIQQHKLLVHMNGRFV